MVKDGITNLIGIWVIINERKIKEYYANGKWKKYTYTKKGKNYKKAMKKEKKK